MAPNLELTAIFRLAGNAIWPSPFTHPCVLHYVVVVKVSQEVKRSYNSSKRKSYNSERAVSFGAARRVFQIDS